MRERDERLPAVPETRVLPRAEVRDPSAATTNIQYMGRDAPMVPQWDAAQAIRYGYLANVIAYRCVQIRARTIASLPIRTGPDPVLRQTINPNSPLAKLLGPPPGGPAPKLSARKLIAWSVAQKIITGRYAWELELEGDTPQYLWPLVATNLKAVPTDGGSEWFRAFTYGRPDKPTRLTPDRVFYDWVPSQDDFRQPESSLQSARYDLSIALMGDRYSYAFLKNGSVPAAVVITQQPPTPEQQQAFEQRWSADYQGPDNAGSTRFQYVKETPEDGDVGKLIDVKTLGLPQKDARFIEQHRASLEMIAISLGVPWSKLDASGRTFDNATQEDQAWWESTILPDLADLEDAWNLDLAPRIGSDFAWFDTSGVKALRTKPEPTSAKVGAPSLVQAQIMKMNEARSDYGLDPTPDGDRFMTVAEIAALHGASGPAVAGTLAASVPEKREAPIEEPPALDPGPTPDEVRQAEEDRAAQVEARRARIWSTADAQVRTLEKRWERAMSRLFTRQAKSAAARLTGKRGHKLLEVRSEPDPNAIFDVPYWLQETADTTSDLYESVTAQGFARVSDSFGVDFDLEAPYAQDFIHARSNQLAGQVTETTYRQIQDVLAAGVEAGDTIDDIAEAVQSVFDAAAARAVTIARTEVIGAFNGSASLAAAQLPSDVVGGQEWIATRDGRTRETHNEADGQAVAVGEPFEVGGGLLAYPGDPQGDAAEVVNCRCTVAFLTPEEFDPEAERTRTVELRVAQLAVRMIQPGDFDEDLFRRTLRSVA